jgi:hypothetical protein
LALQPEIVDGTNRMTDLLQEHCLSLAQAARKLPTVRGAKPPHPATVYRWATAGRKARSGQTVRLEMFRVGGTNCTSMEALTRFFRRLNDVGPVELPTTPKQAALEKQAEQAMDILRQRGLI